LIEELQQQLDTFDSRLEVMNTKYLWAVAHPQSKQSTSLKSRGRRTYTSRKKVKYIDDLVRDIKSNWMQAPIQGMVRVTVLYCFPWRKADKDAGRIVWALMNKVPDIDNCLKPLFDSMKGLCIEDDNQIVEVKARKIRFRVPCIAVRLDEVVERYTTVCEKNLTNDS
jgi:Holliday junction resolvase RusA-like endonuclease